MYKVSVIIPCYNLGKYIHEAIDSVLGQTFQDFEIIIVNDGSTDEETNLILKNLDNSRIKIINTENQGLSAARNTGISQSSGEYILPLDPDDKIASSYMEKAVSILEQNKNIGIVYCLAKFFGDESFEWDLPEYNLPRMLIDNLIFCSAVFRREDWQTVGGYKSSMIYGWEDYDFWWSIIELDREVYRIPEHLFYYRRRNDSMANKMTKEHLYYSYNEIVKNHKDLYINNIQHIFEYIYSLRDEIADKYLERINKDTHIHNLNLEAVGLHTKISGLNEEVSDLNSQISSLNSQISSLNSQISSGRSLIRLVFNFIARKLHLKK